MNWPSKAVGAVLVLLCGSLFVCGQTPPGSSSLSIEVNLKSRTPQQSPVIVIGFVGGFVRHDDAVHSPVQLAERLRGGYPSGVFVEVYENRRREDARQAITKLLDTNQDGKLSDEERRNARIILYGMSWGGSETIELARELQKENIPVLLTIQVDSVAKRGQDNRLIPANVAEAANFYQPDGILHGEPEIKAADPSRTKILGNYRYAYSEKPIDCPAYPWYDRVFTKQHTEIECDPAVWNRVESLIRAKLPPSQKDARAQSSGKN